MEKRILLADDSLTIQKVVELTFAESNYRLTAVSNGRLALEQIAKEPPDLILADVVMPEKNGYELCEEVKRNPATAHIPVVLLAGTFEPFDRARAGRLECDAIVSKPFDSRDLFRKVEALLAEPRPRKPAVAPRETDSERAAPVGRQTLDEIRAPRPFAAAPIDPFGSGFIDEDFTGSIKTFPSARGEPLGSLYGPEDVHSALEAFRQVEPAENVGNRAVAAPEPASSPDDSRTQRIDVSDFRPPAPRATPEPIAAVAPAADSSPPAPRGPAGELTDAEIDRLAERLAQKVIEKLSDRVVREVAWEVVPDTAELVVRERIRELESGVD